MIKATDRDGNSVTLGMLFGGAVQHAVTGAEKSACGRYVVRAGASDAPVCRTCTRLLGLTVRTVETRVPGDCDRDHVHQTLAKWEGKTFTPFELSLFRDVVEDYNNGYDNDPCWIAVVTAILANGGKKITPDVKTPELTKRQGGHNPNAGLINPNSKSVARTPFAGSPAQRDLIDSLVRQIDEINSEIYPNITPLSAGYSEEYISSLNTRAKVKKDIDGLFEMLNILKRKRNEKRSEIRQAEAKTNPAEDGFYVYGDTFVTVKWNRAKTGQYATVWSHDTESWEYGSDSGKIVKMVKAGELARVTEADAQRFGELYGRCMRCSRELTDPNSILASMGKICRGKMGF